MVFIIWSILAVLLGVYVFVFQFLKRFNHWYYVGSLGKTQFPLPPGDMGWPLLGSLPTFLKAFRSSDPESFMHNLFAKYVKTGIYKTYLFGNPCVIVCNPEACRRVLTDDETFKLGYPIATRILTGRTSFHNLSGSEHKRLRRLTTAPINGHEELASHIDMVESIVSTSMEEWASMKNPIELLTEFRRVGFEVITKIFISNFSETIISAIENLYNELNTGMKSPAINLPGFAFRRGLKARKKLIKIFQSILDQKKEMMANNSNIQKEAKKDLMDLLLEVRDEEGRGLEEEDIIDLLIVFMLAGHESTAHTTMWAVIYLSQHPEVVRKAKEEQLEIMKRRPSTQKGLSITEIRQMDYLSKVINETLRRASITISLFREAKVDVNLDGYLIPKGWKVLVWNRSVHMDPQLYENPKHFDPSRWDNYKPKLGSFLPFGAGSRICPGSSLARLEISIFLHYYLLNFKVELLNPDGPVKYLPTARPADLGLARFIKVT